MKTALVTGGAGFIGANLCKRLLDLGYHVVAIDNLITSTGENLVSLKKHPRFKFIQHDITKPLRKKYEIRNKRSLRSGELTNYEIYHLACPTGVTNLGKLAEEMLLTCSIGTKNILDFALDHKSKVLFTSSSEVYGDPKVFPQDETYSGNVDPVGYRSPYEEGKRFAEALVMAYVRKYKLNLKIVRVFNTYGPGMSINDSRVIPRFLRLAKNNQPLTVQGTGKQTRTFCYVDDLVDGLLLIMNKGKRGEVFNLGSDKEVSVNDLAKTILDITGAKSKIAFTKRPSHDHDRRLPDLTKVIGLGWRPKTALTEGIRKTCSLFPP